MKLFHKGESLSSIVQELLEENSMQPGPKLAYSPEQKKRNIMTRHRSKIAERASDVAACPLLLSISVLISECWVSICVVYSLF